MHSLALIRSFFTYQAWANDELMQKIATLDLQKYGSERQLALRLMNHIHIVGQIFAAHLQGKDHSFTSDNTEETPAAEDLRVALAQTDQWYLSYIETVKPDSLSEHKSFVFTDGDRGTMSRLEMLTHVVTHATYHRGEVGRILAQASVSPPWDTFAVFLHQSQPERRNG
jgi:uncharacterized damage-inducible protein DinB